MSGAHADAGGARCRFAQGAGVAETLGISPAARAALPLTHVVVLTQENRSFDHYFGRLWAAGQPEAEGFPASFTNPDAEGHPVAPHHLPSTCLPKDPPHQWAAMKAQWNGGKMNGFVTSADDDDEDGDNGAWAMGYYDERDLPFYYWLAKTFAVGDRHFAAALGGTWPNRQILYTGTGQTPRSASGQMLGQRSIFDALDDARVPWRVYTDGPPRQDCIGWKAGARGVEKSAAFVAALRAGTLPPVVFLDAGDEDEHPPADVQRGERWARGLYDEIVKSPLWLHLAVILTYDEGGGFFDHVPPPAACAPEASKPELDRRGARVPLVVISPWARPAHVSHIVHDHASILRLIELLHDLPALTARDANADALLDLFDFSAPRLATPPAPVAAGTHGCKPVTVTAAR
ncbi:MAG TPA: alkaline phosphatase family protein [Polyangia bacterium]|nr:alkaline phosphatase family protein [Polyangia bacterium]